MKKIISYVLVFVGVLLVAGAGFFAWHTSRPQTSVNVGVDVPETIAGFTLVQSQGGEAAIASFKQLHGVDFQLVSGIVAEYGQNSATLYVAETGSDAQALELIKSMETKIAQSGSQFTPMGVFQFQNRAVYILNGMGRTNFYIQSGRKIFWLAIAPEQAEQAMKELLAFYP